MVETKYPRGTINLPKMNKSEAYILAHMSMEIENKHKKLINIRT